MATQVVDPGPPAALGLGDLPVVPRTFVVATVAVPIVIYGLMPHLHRLRARLLTKAPVVG